MQAGRAIRIISALADGVDPYTGEIFNQDSPFQNPDTVRALTCALDGLKRRETMEKGAKQRPVHSGAPWSEAEDNELMREFKAGEALNEISKKHGRTQGAIQSRINKLSLSVIYQVIANQGDHRP